MVVIFHIEHGCLGPHGEQHVALFCKHFTDYIARAVGHIGVQVFATPRRTGDPEFRYVHAKNPQHILNETEMSQGLSRSDLSRSEFEEGMVDLAAVYEESGEWKNIKQNNPI